MKKIAIQGSQDPVERQEILKILRSWGGMNSKRYSCDSEGYYYIKSNNTISVNLGIFLPEYELLTLKEYKNKYMNKENNKELQIIAPEGYEIDKEQSSFEKIVFKKVEEKLTYEDIAKKLFTDKKHYYTNTCGTIHETVCKTKNTVCFIDPNNAPTYNQLARLLAINKLMNIAHYLNDGWEPNWKDKSEGKYCIIFNGFICTVENNVWESHGGVIFKSMELAEQAIEILGEEQIKLALGVL